MGMLTVYLHDLYSPVLLVFEIEPRRTELAEHGSVDRSQFVGKPRLVVYWVIYPSLQRLLFNE